MSKLDATKEEKDMMKEFIVLELVMQIIEKDKAAIQESKVKMKEPYLFLLHKSEEAAIRDNKEIKHYFRKNGIKVYRTENDNEDFVEYGYLVRGYQGYMRYFRYALKNYTRDKLQYYFGKK